MRIFMNLVSVFLITLVAYFASLNAKVGIDVVLMGFRSHKTFLVQTESVYLILGIFFIGILVGIIWTSAFCIQLQAKLKEYKRKLEKTSVQTDEGSSRVAVLESKIETLEKALEKALNKDN